MRFYNDPIVVIPIKYVTSFQRRVSLVHSDGDAASPQAELWLRKLNSPLKHSITHVSQTAWRHQQLTLHPTRLKPTLYFQKAYERKYQELTTFIFPENKKFSFEFH